MSRVGSSGCAPPGYSSDDAIEVTDDETDSRPDEKRGRVEGTIPSTTSTTTASATSAASAAAVEVRLGIERAHQAETCIAEVHTGRNRSSTVDHCRLSPADLAQ